MFPLHLERVSQALVAEESPVGCMWDMDPAPGLLAQALSPHQQACMGVYVHTHIGSQEHTHTHMEMQRSVWPRQGWARSTGWCSESVRIKVSLST